MGLDGTSNGRGGGWGWMGRYGCMCEMMCCVGIVLCKYCVSVCVLAVLYGLFTL